MCKVTIQVLKLAFLVTDRPNRMTNAALIITHSRLLFQGALRAEKLHPTRQEISLGPASRSAGVIPFSPSSHVIFKDVHTLH